MWEYKLKVSKQIEKIMRGCVGYRCAHKLLNTFIFMKIFPEQDTRKNELIIFSSQTFPLIKNFQLDERYNRSKRHWKYQICPYLYPSMPYLNTDCVNALYNYLSIQLLIITQAILAGGSCSRWWRSHSCDFAAIFSFKRMWTSKPRMRKVALSTRLHPSKGENRSKKSLVWTVLWKIYRENPFLTFLIS
jgi:hypothetical protein